VNPKAKLAVHPSNWPSLTKDMQIGQLLCWSGMTDNQTQIINNALYWIGDKAQRSVLE